MQFGSGSKNYRKKSSTGLVPNLRRTWLSLSLEGRQRRRGFLPHFFHQQKVEDERVQKVSGGTPFFALTKTSLTQIWRHFLPALSLLFSQGKFHNFAPGYQSTWMGKVNKGVHMDIFHFYQCYGAEILFQLILGTENFYRHWKLFTFVTLHYSFFTSYRRNFYKKLCCWDTGK